MSTVAQAIPESVSTRSPLPSWRIANGAICMGREEDNNLETRKQLVGRIQRVGVHHGTLDDGRTYSRVEVDLETADGIQSVGASLSSLTSSITLAEGLLDTAAGELIAIEANASKVKNRYGSYSTYANCFHVDPITLKARPTARNPYDKDANPQDRLDALLEALKNHPNYAERPKRGDDAENEFYENASGKEAFDKEAQAKGWPSLLDAKKEYLEMAGQIGETKYAKFDDVPEDVWASMRQGLAETDGVPKLLAKYVANGKKNPFKDE